jgi:glycosyltransferase involved in cell wall biosynthesis
MSPEGIAEAIVPKVSVYIPTYNYGRFLAEAIQSVLDQTFQDWELIVVDDGSTDNTREVVDAFQDPRIHYIYQENQGNPAARNTALRLVKGEYVACLDADDILFSEKLEKQVAQLDSLPPTVGLVYGDVYLFNHEDGAIICRFLQGRTPPRGRIFDELLDVDGWFISDTASLIRREVFDRVGLYDPSVLTYEDWMMWVRIASVYEVEALDEPLARCRRHSSNLSGLLEDMYRHGVTARRKVMASYPLSRKQRRALRHNLAHLEYAYGIGLLKGGKRREAWKAFFRSLRLRPGERKTYIHLGLPLLSPRLYTFLYRWYCTIRGLPLPAEIA